MNRPKPATTGTAADACTKRRRRMWKQRPRGPRRKSRPAAVATIALLALLASTAPAAQAAPTEGEPADRASAKIEKPLGGKFAVAAMQDFLVRFTERADLTEAGRTKDWDVRGATTANALKASAARSQRGVRALLDKAKVSYKSFWATNAIYVEDGSATLAQQLAGRAEVQMLYEPRTYEIPVVAEDQPSVTPQSLQWGIADVNADDVWTNYGITGEGVVVASIDSGVQYDHPALVKQYRGTNGDGTFDHNYNWFDASGTCGGKPCDLNGHGTHTMGTMVGDDRAGNQIGMAPGATWITTNGCCDSDTTLIESGQWLLEPTDLNGQNPDVSKRPNIINNSWGTQSPSNDPFMEDISRAWEASGIFSVWANGNIGSACNTSGSPGSRIINYSVGNYDSNHAINPYSSRGAGQDGETKPNISAPGSAIRSSVPGSGYAHYSGTSMAAPHVAGAIALAWSAAPTLLGDVAATKALMDGSAVDTPDNQCGGTDDDNNVFGEGRLDALALLAAAPTRDTGVLSGTVTDATSGGPVAEAKVSLTGLIARTVSTDASGRFELRLPVGAYDLSVSKFGYATDTFTAVKIDADRTTTLNVPLASRPSSTVTGTITDGSGQGWPLYAKLDVGDTPVSAFTNPVTGAYSLNLPSGTSYRVQVTAQYAGYDPKTVALDLTAGGNVTLDVTLEVNLGCNAPGYRLVYEPVLRESFDTGKVPDGWTVVDNLGTGRVWTFNDPENWGNLTGGDGAFADVNGDYYGPPSTQDTALVTPVLDLSDITDATLEFATDYLHHASEKPEIGLSVDGGATWTTVWTQDISLRGPRKVQVSLPGAAGEPDVQIRFHYRVGTWSHWWQVDDVFVGLRDCVPLDVGLMVGNVYDANDRTPVNGATVTSDEAPHDTATTVATPQDDALADGFYWMYSSLTGKHPFTATKARYQSTTRPVDVVKGGVTSADFLLGAGRLTVKPSSVQASVPLGGVDERTFTITNDGTAPVELEITENDGSFTILKADGTRTSSTRIAGSTGTSVNRVKTNVTPLPLAPSATTADDAKPPVVPHGEPWTDLPNYPTNIMDNHVGYLDGKVYSFGGTESGFGTTSASYVYDPTTLTWTALAPMPEGRQQASSAFVDGRFYLIGGWSGGDGATVGVAAIYDPETNTWTKGARNHPSPAAAAGTAVLNEKIYMVGGCTSSCGTRDVVVYDTETDTYQTAADYPTNTSWLACAGLDGKVVCAGGFTGSTSSVSTYSYDPATDSWTRRADLPGTYDAWGTSYSAANGQLLLSGGAVADSTAVTNEGYAYDPRADKWTALPNSNNSLYRGAAACGFFKIGGSWANWSATPASEVLPGYEDCRGPGVSWLSAGPTTATIKAGDSLTVGVLFDSAAVSQPGTYTAELKIKENTPHPGPTIGVTMNVVPPKSWGKLTGTVSGQSTHGAVTPVAGAIVQVNDANDASTLVTGADGSYARWMNQTRQTLQIVVAKHGYVPQSRETRIMRGRTTTENFTLQPLP
ncbi:S8 family serine peptidase [Micromonospora echinospora]|nr:S8 family serine peptidase [Micromonospora echinospora]